MFLYLLLIGRVCSEAKQNNRKSLRTSVGLRTSREQVDQNGDKGSGSTINVSETTCAKLFVDVCPYISKKSQCTKALHLTSTHSPTISYDAHIPERCHMENMLLQPTKPPVILSFNRLTAYVYKVMHGSRLCCLYADASDGTKVQRVTWAFLCLNVSHLGASTL
jgi:hypothetical protein